MKRIFACLFLAASALGATLKPYLPVDGAGLSSEAQQTFRENIGLTGLSASGGVLTYTGADALFSGATSTAPNAKSVITRERGDARWGSIESVQSRAPLDYLQSDGVTTARRIELVAPSAAINIAGQDWTYVGEPVLIPTSNPSETAFFFGWVSSPTIQPNTQSNALSVSINSSGDLTIFQDKDGGDHRTLTYSGFRAAYSGQAVRLIIAFSGDSPTAPTVWANGTDISSNFVLTTSEPPNWVHTTLTTDYFVQGYNWPAGPFRPGRAVTRKFTQSDVDFVMRSGMLAAFDADGGGRQLLTSGPSNSSYASFQFSSVSGDRASATGVYNGANASNRLSFSIGSGVPLVANKLYRLTFNYSFSGSWFRVYSSHNAALDAFSPSKWLTDQIDGPSGSGSVSTIISVTGSQVASTFRLAFMVSAPTGNLTLTDVRLVPLGALADPVVQPILTLDDGTANGFQSRLVGFEPVTPRKDWRLVARTATNGNAQLLGGSVFRDANRHRIDSIVVRNAGSSRTISIGNASGGSQYVSSATAAAGLSDHTPATRFNGTENIWIASDGTDELTTTITGHRVQ